MGQRSDVGPLGLLARTRSGKGWWPGRGSGLWEKEKEKEKWAGLSWAAREKRRGERFRDFLFLKLFSNSFFKLSNFT
jgi:hypothetical protein